MRLSPILAAVCLALIALAGPVAAHTRHDNVRAVELSPDFANDGTVFAVTQLSDDILFARSWDRGRTWEERAHPLLNGIWGGDVMSGVHGESVARSNQPDASCDLEFHGDSIQWFSMTNESSGLAKVWLDGLLEATIDLYSPEASPAKVLWSKTFRAVGNHDLRVVVTGMKNAASQDSQVTSDGFAFTF